MQRVLHGGGPPQQGDQSGRTIPWQRERHVSVKSGGLSKMEYQETMYKIPEEEVDRMQERMHRLTGRQSEILDHVLAGSTNEEIATLLGISRRTVETHRLRVMAALGAHNTAELVGKVVWLRAREHFLDRVAV